MRKLDITNQTFGKLTAIRLSHMQGGRAHWLCRCECERELTAGVAWLRSGNTTSCGSCSKLGNARALRHGYSPKGPRTPTYNTWQAMKKRCNDPNSTGFENYGGRGITVCERWHDFQNFLADMGERPPGLTIDRIDNNLGYYPDNCRWATDIEQNINRSSKHKNPRR